MARGTPLLNADGTASTATLMLLSHHAFRRDLLRFERALGGLHEHESPRADTLRGEWQQYRGALHGHHEMEDKSLFPDARRRDAALAPSLDQLVAEHARMEPLLARGDHAFEGMTDVGAARILLRELGAALDEHLRLEEETVVPVLRADTAFPPPPDDAVAEQWAAGFAWSMQGIADDVLERIKKMLPEKLVSRLPAAMKAYDERCERVWGSSKTGKSRTSVPEG